MSAQSESDVSFNIYTTIYDNGSNEWRLAVESDPEIGSYHINNYSTSQWEIFFTYSEAKQRASILKDKFNSDFKLSAVTYEPDYFDDEGWE